MGLNRSHTAHISIIEAVDMRKLSAASPPCWTSARARAPGLFLRRCQRRRHQFDPLLQGVGVEMGVAFGHADVVVAEQLLHLVDRGAVVDQKAGIGVAQVVDADVGQICLSLHIDPEAADFLDGLAWRIARRPQLAQDAMRAGMQGGESTNTLDPALAASEVPFAVNMIWGEMLVDVSASGEMKGAAIEPRLNEPATSAEKTSIARCPRCGSVSRRARRGGCRSGCRSGIGRVVTMSRPWPRP